MHSAGIAIVSNSDDVVTAGPVHYTLGKAHGGAAAPPAVVRGGRSVDDIEQDQQEALCLVVCPQQSLCREACQVSPLSRGGTGLRLGVSPGQAGDEAVLCLSYHGQGDTAGELTLTGGRWLLWWTLLINFTRATLFCFK